MLSVSPVGRPGVWTAQIPEMGVTYGVSHAQFREGDRYREVCDDRKMPEHAARLAADGRVILSKDKLRPTGNLKRTGYVGVFAIANVAYNFSTYELTFDIVEELATC